MKIILISLLLFIFSIKSHALQVVDQNGRNISFDSEVKRVVSIQFQHPQCLFPSTVKQINLLAYMD